MLAVVSSVRVRCAALRTLIGLVLTLIPLISFAAGNITLAWDPVPSVAGYNLYYGTASRVYPNMLAAGNTTTITVSNLAIGTAYYFAATAYDTFGIESDFSVEVSGNVSVPVNQPPTLDPIASVTLNENAGAQTVNLSGISSGASNEIQTLTVTASSSNPSLVPNPTVNYTSPSTGGVLTFAPVAMAFGSATITVTVNDGGASNNIISRSFAVTVSPVNQPPTLNPLANLTINENSGVQTVNLSGISSGANNELQTLVVTAISSNPGVIPNPAVNYTSPSATGFLTFAPVTSALGSATLTVTVNDGGTSNNIVSRSFTVTINSLPTISAMTNLVIAVNTATPLIPFTIGDVETAASNLTVSASSDNAALVQSANIAFGGAGASRTIKITPIAGQTGVANITVSVSDGTATANSAFLLSVEPKPGRPGNLRIVGNP